jgi:hypothetical protein
MKTISWLSLAMIALSGLSLNLFAADSTAISVSSNGRYFLDGNGSPWYWLGDTEWELFNRLSVADAQLLCNNRRAKGINVLLVMVFGVPGPGSANVNNQRPFLNDNIAAPNEPYFAHIDSIIDAAHKSGIVLVIGIYHKNWSQFSTTNARAWATWIGQRFASKKNLAWSMYPTANSSYVNISRELAAGLQAGDTGHHLITMHPDPSPASSSWMHTESWLSFNTLQTWVSDHSNYDLIAVDYAKTPVKPAVNGEARYETEGGTTPLGVRNGAYWSICAGGFYTYGHGGNWLSPTDWRNWVDAPGAGQMKILGDLMRSLTWWKAIPDQTVISVSAGQNAAIRSSDSSWVLVYLPTNTSVTIWLDKTTGADSVIAQWMDPLTGNKTIIGTYAAAGTKAFTSPSGWQDAVLLLENAGGVTAVGSSKARLRDKSNFHQKLFSGIINENQKMIPANSAISNIRGQQISLRKGQNPNQSNILKTGVYIINDKSALNDN